MALAGGVESMSRALYVLAKAGMAFSRSQTLEDTTIGWRFVNPAMAAHHGVDTMPETAENLAREHGISRVDQDSFALRSQQRVAAAREFHAGEIVPVAVSRKGCEQVIDRDEHPRETSLEALADLTPIARADGTVTAGNASGVGPTARAYLFTMVRRTRRRL